MTFPSVLRNGWREWVRLPPRRSPTQELHKNDHETDLSGGSNEVKHADALDLPCRRTEEGNAEGTRDGIQEENGAITQDPDQKDPSPRPEHQQPGAKRLGRSGDQKVQPVAPPLQIVLREHPVVEHRGVGREQHRHMAWRYAAQVRGAACPADSGIYSLHLTCGKHSMPRGCGTQAAAHHLYRPRQNSTGGQPTPRPGEQLPPYRLSRAASTNSLREVLPWVLPS